MTNITTTDYDNITDYDIFFNNCPNNENKIDITIATLLLTIPCGLSYLGWMSLMIYTLSKPLIKKNYKNFLLDRLLS